MARARNRGLVWLITVAGVLALGIAVAGLRNWVPAPFAWMGAALFLVCLAGIGMIGWRTRRDVLAQRELVAHGQMIVMLAARLRDEDAETLHQMRARGGSAGEAATLILQGRAERGPRSPGATS